jgi:hypothetical protein
MDAHAESRVQSRRLMTLLAYCLGAALMMLVGVARASRETDRPGSTHYSVEHSTLDGGGGYRASASYTQVGSLGGWGGLGQTEVSTTLVRRGYVGQLNEPPAAHTDAFKRQIGLSLRVPAAHLVANDTDAESDVLRLVTVATRSEKGAAIELDGDWVIYRFPTDLHETDTFTYTVADTCGATAIGRVTVLLLVPGDTLPQALIHLDHPAHWTNGLPVLRLQIPPLPRIILQRSADLKYWEPIVTNVPMVETVNYLDAQAANQSLRFYRAVTMIVGRQDFRLTPERLPEGALRLLVQDPGRQETVLEVSSNLVRWEPLLTNTSLAEVFEFTDYPVSPAFRFYRALSVP